MSKSDFLLKYGDGREIDRVLKVDEPWPAHKEAFGKKDYVDMHHAIVTSIGNPNISNAAVIKASAFPHTFTDSRMGEYLEKNKDRDIHPDVLTAIAKNVGHADHIRSRLEDREDLPKEAWAHMAKHAHDKMLKIPIAHEFYRKQRDHYLEKAK